MRVAGNWTASPVHTAISQWRGVRAQARLNLVNSAMFPLFWVAGHAAPDRPAAPEGPAPADGQGPRNMTQFWLRPAVKIGTLTGALPSGRACPSQFFLCILLQHTLPVSLAALHGPVFEDQALPAATCSCLHCQRSSRGCDETCAGQVLPTKQ